MSSSFSDSVVSLPSWVLALLSAILLIVYIVILVRLPKINYPPGPRPDPIIGHLRSMPTANPHLTFSKWGKQYGDVVFVQCLGKKILVLNSFDAARDLLQKRSSIYSDRPRFVLLEEVMGWDAVVTHMRYSPRFRKHRRFIHESFHQEAIKNYYPLVEKETLTLVQGLAKSPDAFFAHIRRYTASMIMQIVYGHRVETDDDFFVNLAERATTATVESGSMGSTIIDLIPPLRHLPAWFPGLSSKRHALKVREEVIAMLQIPFNMVKDQMAAGVAPTSFTSTLLEAHRRGVDGVSPEDQGDIQGAAGVLYGAATDTSTCVLGTFILAMVRYPGVFAKAQEEIDAVIGFDRLPTISDRDSLPYLSCVFKEVLRWNSPVPLGIPHRLMEADYYRDYYIPPDTMVIANLWGLTQACSQPAEFIPERYEKGCEEDGLVDPTSIVFGFGRRICAGKHFAETTVWLAMARLIAAFNISNPTDEKGREYTPPAAFTSRFIRHPQPFQCTIQVRPERASDPALSQTC